jgi:hypothetical protein
MFVSPLLFELLLQALHFLVDMYSGQSCTKSLENEKISRM